MGAAFEAFVWQSLYQRMNGWECRTWFSWGKKANVCCLLQQLPLREGSPILSRWSKVVVPIYFKIYVFDVVNKEEFSNGLDDLKVVQRGPYTFFETREKVIDSFSNDTETIFYDDIKKFYFDPEMSAGSLEDEVDVINVPLMVRETLVRS